MNPVAVWAMLYVAFAVGFCFALGCAAAVVYAARRFGRWVERELQIRQEIAEAERLLRLSGKLNLTIDEVLEIEREHA